MSRIYLARHGQDEDNIKGILNGRRDKPLTNKGKEQAKELADKIKSAGITFDKVYSSPLKRAYKSEEIITKVLGTEKPQIMKDLIEREFGIMTGQHHSKIAEMRKPHILKTDTLTYFLKPKGAETFPQLKTRGRKILNKIIKLHKNGSILLVTHGDIGKMIYAAYYRLGWKEVLKLFHFGNSDLLLLSTDSPAKEAHVFKTEQHNL